jgi:hypothetical protein
VNWDVNGKDAEADLFEPFSPAEVLFDFDGPRIFTFISQEEELFLAYLFDEEVRTSRYLVVPTSERLIRQMKAGELSVRDALCQPRLWVLDVVSGQRISRSWRTSFESLPDDAIPEPGAMLWPSLEPLLSLRSIGILIKEGMTPASVIRNAIDGAEKTIKILIEYVLQLGQQAGRPSGAVRRLYDLPAQRLAFNSFEIAFRRPVEGDQAKMGEIGATDLAEEEAVYRQVGELLQEGLKWVTGTAHDLAAISPNEEARRVILRAIESLTPPAQGPVMEVELRGTMIGELGNARRPVRLNRNTRGLVRRALKEIDFKERFVEPTGLIREADKDRFTFELRDIEGPVGMMKFTFDEEFEDDVSDAFIANYRVKVWGVEEPVRNLFRVVAIQKREEEQLGSAASPPEVPPVG